MSAFLRWCSRCEINFTRTNWQLHGHNPAQINCTSRDCGRKAVGYSGSEYTPTPLCGEHLMDARRNGSGVTFVDGRVCRVCVGHGRVNAQEIRVDSPGGQWPRCADCMGTGYDPTLRLPSSSQGTQDREQIRREGPGSQESPAERRIREAEQRAARSQWFEREIAPLADRFPGRQTSGTQSQGAGRPPYIPPTTPSRYEAPNEKGGGNWALIFLIFIVIAGFVGFFLFLLYHEDSPFGRGEGLQNLVSFGSAPTPTPGPAATLIPTPTPSPTPIAPPDQRYHRYKVYMLELINKERVNAGVGPVTLGNNIAAQLHAESSLANCFSSHWGVDGLKPYMRYSLAGGYQSNSENWYGSKYCIKASDGYRALGSIESTIREMMESLMDSPGHRRSILDKWHKKVNIGLAWDTYNLVGLQHFEGEYVEFDALPGITDGILTLSGRAINGLHFSNKDDLGLQIFYDPPPHTLTRGQISRTYCYDYGLQIAGLRSYYWTSDQYSSTHTPCADPYDVSPGAAPPRSADEAREFWERAYAASQAPALQIITVPWLTASEWTAAGTDFSVTADIGDLLSKYGPGVYTILLWGKVGGEDVPISQYSIFYEVEPSDIYNPDLWK